MLFAYLLSSHYFDIISLQIVFNYFTLMRRSHWKILKSKQSSNQFLMLQKNCLKFSFYILIHWYMYIISSFVFCHTIPVHIFCLKSIKFFYIFIPTQIFLRHFLLRYTLMTCRWKLLYSFESFFLYYLLKIKKIFFLFLFFL